MVKRSTDKRSYSVGLGRGLQIVQDAFSEEIKIKASKDAEESESNGREKHDVIKIQSLQWASLRTRRY